MTRLSFPDLEALYDELANAIDSVPPERESVFLAKLVLALAHEFGDAGRISELIRQCLAETPVEPGTPVNLVWGEPDDQ